MSGRSTLSRLREAGVDLVCRVTPTCAEMTRLFSRIQDGGVSLWTWVRMRLHMAICVWCRRYGAQLDILRRLGRKFPEAWGECGGEKLSPEAKERIRRAVENGDK